MRSANKPIVVAILSALSFAACATAQGGPARSNETGRVLTVAEIQRTYAANAWEVLKRAGLPLNLIENDVDELVISRRRGIHSTARGALVVHNGMPVDDLGVLRMIPAEVIQSIRIDHKLSDLPIAAPSGANPSVVIHITTVPPR